MRITGPVAKGVLSAARPRECGPVFYSAEPIVPDVLGGVLIRFRHGFGDNVQLTALLAHLRHYHDWRISVECRPGCGSLFAHLADAVYARGGGIRADRRAFDRILSLSWPECHRGYRDAPSTKVTRCLREQFQLAPVLDLCRYSIAIPEHDRRITAGYLRRLAGEPDGSGRFPVVAIHYLGHSSQEKKNLPSETAAEICRAALRSGCVPLILEWDGRSKLPNGCTIHSAGRSHHLWDGLHYAECSRLAALIAQCRLMVGIDSGPLHVAGATKTPTLGVWTEQHPIHFYDMADNVTHLVPQNHAQKAAHAALDFFAEHYNYHVYSSLDDLPQFVRAFLSERPREALESEFFMTALTSKAYNRDYYEQHRTAGLDYLGYGEWQQRYGRWLSETLDWKMRRVLDVGCACGAILRGLGEAGIVVQGVDLSEHMIRLGRQKWPDMSPLLHVCDAVNLHLFGEGEWDGIHCAQVAEHWKPELVPLILRELARVTKQGGLFFCTLDTEESILAQGRNLDGTGEDATHVCFRPMAWWHDQLRDAGWEVCTEEFLGALEEHAESMQREYNWPFWVARKK